MKTLAILAALGIFSVVAHARIVGTAPTNPDAACWYGQQGHVGGSQTGAEICVDASGNIVPTVTNKQALGSSTLAFSAVTATAITPLSYLTLPIATTTQIATFVYPVGATVYVEENVAGSLVTNNYNICVSTVAKASSTSFVYTQVSTAVIAGVPVVGAACNN